MKTYAAKDAKNNFGAMLDDVQRDTVQLTRNGRRVAVIMNQERADKLMSLERKDAQLKMLKSLEALAKEADKRPRPTRAELRDLLECDDDEIDAFFEEDFFQSK